MSETSSSIPAPASVPVPRVAYRPVEWAEATGVSHAMVLKYLSLGKLPARKMGDAVIILADEGLAALKRLPVAEYKRMKPATETT